MDFIFMLTRQDQTVVDALEVFAEIRPLGLRHVGFKDVGVDKGTLHALDQAIKAAGATSYMEVVSTSPEAALQSARVAAEIGIDRLLGGTSVAEILAIIVDLAGRTSDRPRPYITTSISVSGLTAATSRSQRNTAVWSSGSSLVRSNTTL